jgi:hypothetical protein
MKSHLQSLLGIALACCTLLLGASRACSQAPLRDDTRKTTTPQVRKVSSVIGASVQLQAGGTFGKIEDIIINDQGCIDFVIVVFEEKLFAIPFSITRVDFSRGMVTIDAERELLLRAPSFTRTTFPDLSANSEFGRKVESHFDKWIQSREGPPQSRQPQTKLTSLPVGRWTVEFANGVKAVYQVRKDRRASVSEQNRTSTGKAELKDGSVLIVYQDDRVERWTPLGKRMLIEHWFARAQFPSGTPVLGIAEAAR